jgi:CRISPR/Cas system CSM-associated protein Csm3 (group 7 of RAMP superfamily)
MSDKQTFYSKKPYFFVPLVKRVHREKRDDRRNALGGASGILAVTLTAMTPLHFGQGDLRSFDGKLIHALTREGETIALPGASFKGMLRSVFEATTNSCVSRYPRDMRHLLPNQNNFRCERPLEQICPACSVFGCLGVKGKIQFSSFRIEGRPEIAYPSLPALQSPFKDYPNGDKRGIGNERLYYGWFKDIQGPDVGDMTKDEFFRKLDNKIQDYGQFYGRKFYKHSQEQVEGSDALQNTYECLQAGSELHGEIVYEGLRESELQALLFALGLGWETPIFHKLGHAKPAYFGSVKIDVHRKDSSLRSHSFGNDQQIDLETLAKKHRSSADDDVKKAMEEIQRQWSSLDGGSPWESVEGKTY